ncbi:CPBP family intramembrane metalloprotease [Clostridium sp. CS001]|uniref:CPBP family intramembrane glutamic endopeptidase n=1 Tax=Clostridium sp. CS001 TaxID=2880648 RepID=UPI001CF471B5|nr:type II CAAX endopeptidase family protein [Clostridium sp. CS001]MCB2290565.1 CPBP family intramembrane metalloprotease [Clostridium sp. CS001]
MKNKRVLLANSLLVLALSLFVLIPILANHIFKLNGIISGNVSLLLSGGASVLVFGGISLLYCKITKRKFVLVMNLKKISIRQAILVVFVAIGTYIFAVGVNAISMQLFPIAVKDSQAISKLLNSSSTLLGLIVVVLIPAFFEEVFFRGVLLDAYEGLNKKLKYFILTLIFATFHGNVMQIIYVMFLGLILLKVREYTGSLLGSITLHAVNNAISFTLSKVAMYVAKLQASGIKGVAVEPKKTAEAMNISLRQALITAIIFFLIGGSILYINLRKLKEYKEAKEALEFIEEESVVIKDGNLINVGEYIPLIIYFVAITVVVVLSY